MHVDGTDDLPALPPPPNTHPRPHPWPCPHQLELTKPVAVLQRTFTYFFTNSLRFGAPCSSFNAAYVAVRDKMCCDIVYVPVCPARVRAVRVFLPLGPVFQLVRVAWQRSCGGGGWGVGERGRLRQGGSGSAVCRAAGRARPPPKSWLHRGWRWVRVCVGALRHAAPRVCGVCGVCGRSGYAYLSLGWLVLGLSTVVCGFPAGILGYKRFPRNIWVRGRSACLVTCWAPPPPFGRLGTVYPVPRSARADAALLGKGVHVAWSGGRGGMLPLGCAFSPHHPIVWARHTKQGPGVKDGVPKKVGTYDEEAAEPSGAASGTSDAPETMALLGEEGAGTPMAKDDKVCVGCVDV